MADVFNTECAICGKTINFSQDEFSLLNTPEPLCDEHQQEVKAEDKHFEVKNDDEIETNEEEEERQISVLASNVKIYLDPGHGGTDPGAVGNGIREKDITLKIGLKIREYLNEYNGVAVRMSRTGDTTRSLSWRTSDANRWGANYLVSIHVNAGGGTGFESFIYNGSLSRNTSTWQNRIHPAIVKKINMRDRGRKRANFHMLRVSNMESVLTENGFIDRKADADKLKTQKWINDTARGHVDGLVNIFNLKKKSGSSGNTNTTRNPSIRTGGLSPESLAEVSEWLTRKGWYWTALGSKGENPKITTGGLSTSMQKEFSDWLDTKGWWHTLVN